jgi:hypothetical protein
MPELTPDFVEKAKEAEAEAHSVYEKVYDYEQAASAYLEAAAEYATAAQMYAEAKRKWEEAVAKRMEDKVT